MSPWVRLDDKFHSHPKVMAVGNEGAGLYVRALAYCADHLTDGCVPEAWALANGPPALLSLLVHSGLWELRDGHYFIPDYLKFNPSRQIVEERRSKRSAAGRVGAYVMWHGKSHGKGHGTTHDESQDLAYPREGDGKSHGKSQTESHSNRITMEHAPSPQSQSRTTGSNEFLDLDDERRREMERIWPRLNNADDGTAGVLMFYARQLPFGALAKVRESVESQERPVATGWVVNALKDEIAMRSAT